MPTTINLTSDSDSITFSGTDYLSGWTYDNECLNAWFSLAKAQSTFLKRGSGHGSFSPGRLFAGDAMPLLSGRYWGTSPGDAHAAMTRLNGMFEDGLPVVMTVTDENGPTSRVVWVLEVNPVWSHTTEFTFDFALDAPDPRRYGPLITFPSTGLPTAPTGLTWPLGSAASGLYFDWGTAGNPGSITITNNGNTTAYPTILVGGGGAFAAGFTMTETDTARALTYPLPLASTDVLALDNRTRRARMNGGGDVTEQLSARGWFEIPKGKSRTYLMTSLGGITGAPTFTATLKPAYL